MNSMQIPNSNHIFYATEEGRLFPTHNNNQGQLSNTPPADIPASSFKELELEKDLMEADKALEELKNVRDPIESMSEGNRDFNGSNNIQNENFQSEKNVNKNTVDISNDYSNSNLNLLNIPDMEFNEDSHALEKDIDKGKKAIEEKDSENINMNEIIKKNEEQINKLVEETKLVMSGKNEKDVQSDKNKDKLEKNLKKENSAIFKNDIHVDKKLSNDKIIQTKIENPTNNNKNINLKQSNLSTTNVSAKQNIKDSKNLKLLSIEKTKALSNKDNNSIVSEVNTKTKVKGKLNLVNNTSDKKNFQNSKQSFKTEKTVKKNPLENKDYILQSKPKTEKKKLIDEKDKLVDVTPAVKTIPDTNKNLKSDKLINELKIKSLGNSKITSNQDINKLIQKHEVKENKIISSKLLNDQQNHESNTLKEHLSSSNLNKQNPKNSKILNVNNPSAIRHLGNDTPSITGKRINSNVYHKNIRLSINGPLDDSSNIYDSQIKMQNRIILPISRPVESLTNPKNISQKKSPFADGPISDENVPDMPIFLEKKSNTKNKRNFQRSKISHFLNNNNKSFEYIPFKFNKNTNLIPIRELTEREKLLQEVDKNNQSINGILNKQENLLRNKNIYKK